MLLRGPCSALCFAACRSPFVVRQQDAVVHPGSKVLRFCGSTHGATVFLSSADRLPTRSLAMTTTAATPPTDRTRVNRVARRGHYDAATLHAILDAAYVCH